MSEIVARSKFACPGCGAEAQWNPAKHALVCPFCGTVSPMAEPPADAKIEEHDLAAALHNIPDDQRGWEAEKKSVKCQSCQAITVFDPTRTSQRCDFCGSAALIPFEEIKAPIRPESLLEFKLAEGAVRDSIRAWYGNRWFAPNKLKKRALTDTIHGIYLPYWTFDAQVHADWVAEAGHHYYTTETYSENGQQKSRQVQHTRWVPASGQLDNFFDDELVPASKGVPADMLAKIEPFPTTTDLKPYEPGYLSGWVAEQYQIDLPAAAQNSRTQMDRKLEKLCGAQVPGDTYRNLRVQSDYSGQTYKHILVPVWVVAYTYGSKSFQIVVNGYTGTIAGKHPLSWIKITLAVLAALIALVIFIIYSQHN